MKAPRGAFRGCHQGALAPFTATEPPGPPLYHTAKRSSYHLYKAGGLCYYIPIKITKES